MTIILKKTKLAYMQSFNTPINSSQVPLTYLNSKKYTNTETLEKGHTPPPSLSRTSCRCPASRRSGMMHGVLTSRWRMSLSREPEESTSPFQASAPTRAVWPLRMQTRLLLATSHTCTNPLCVPTATWLPCTPTQHMLGKQVELYINSLLITNYTCTTPLCNHHHCCPCI